MTVFYITFFQLFVVSKELNGRLLRLYMKPKNVASKYRVMFFLSSKTEPISCHHYTNYYFGWDNLFLLCDAFMRPEISISHSKI